jgi:hypothetical protein
MTWHRLRLQASPAFLAGPGPHGARVALLGLRACAAPIRDHQGAVTPSARPSTRLTDPSFV